MIHALRQRPLLGLGLLVALGSCGGGGGDEGPPALPFGLEGTFEVTGLAFEFGLTQPGDIATSSAYPNIGISAVELLAVPGENRMVALDKSGFATIFDDDPTVSTATTYLDLNASIENGGEGGLLSGAYHPDYPNEPYFYAFYAAGAPLRSVVSRFEVIDGFPDVSTEQVLLEVPKTNNIHFGGKIAFGMDGFLYVSIGDDGRPETAQDLGSLSGKLLRLTDTGAPAPGNPFSSVPDAAPEIWAYGLRNLWRFTFDSLTGEVWGADVGEDRREEIDLLIAGRNYGWPMFEGSLEFDNPDGVPFADTEAPLFEYDHGVGGSIIGGIVYRGSDLPSLDGAYLYADSVVGRMWALRKSTSDAVNNELIATGLSFPVTLGINNAGLPVIGTLVGGEVITLEETGDGAEPVEVPELLSETNVFTNLANLDIREGFVPYDVNSELWSDGSSKERWIGLPPGARISFDPSGNWTFPVGTIFVKQFNIELATGDIRRLETRVMYRTVTAWSGFSYRWNNEQTDATRVDMPESEVFEIADEFDPTGMSMLEWRYPSPAQCFACHTPAAGFGLGLRTEQLNGDFDYPNATDNQLRTLEHIDFFTSPINDPATLPALVDPLDDTQLMPDRARSYLAANCAHCHRPGGFTGIDMDLRALTLTELMNTHGVAPVAGDLGLPNAARIQPFARESSVALGRMLSETFTRMPPLGTQRLDFEGLQVIADWIDAGALDPNGSLGVE